MQQKQGKIASVCLGMCYVLCRKPGGFRMINARPAVARLIDLLVYDPDAGKLFWRDAEACRAAGRPANWTSRWAGREAFTAINGGGYRKGAIDGYQTSAHLVIWAMQTGAWPEHEVDHEDTDRLNNRWINLREATRAQNQHNKRIYRNNASGVKGVTWHRRDQKWVAEIGLDNRSHHLGYFDSKEEAAAAYAKASANLHAEFGRVA